MGVTDEGKLSAQSQCGAGELPGAQPVLAAVSEGGDAICKEIFHSFGVPTI